MRYFSGDLIRGCLARWSGAMLLLIWLLPVSPAVHAAKGWETTEWAVICSSELIRTMPSEVCDDTAVTGPASATRYGLEEASAWLKGLGFRGPDVETLGGKGSPYKAYISDAENIDEHGHASDGIYDAYERTLYMSSDYYFAVGEGDTPEQREQNLALDLPATYSMVHELFHAVQHSYQQGAAWRSDAHHWIFEGTADAVKVAWQGKKLGAVQGRARSYEDPLHQPRGWEDAYDTHHFWTRLGQMLGSTDRVQYLHHLLQQDLEASRGLDGIHEGLKRWHGDGLYEFYPSFIARHARQEVFFDNVTEHTLTYPEDERTIAGQTVRPVASRAHRVVVDVPNAKTAGLKIKLNDDDRPDLHLIVDEWRQGKIAQDGSARNVYNATLHEPETLLVRVANIARDAPASQEHRYDLKLELRPLEPCGLETMEAAAADTLGLSAAQAPTPGAMVDDTDMSGAAQDFVERVARAFRRPGASILPGEGRLAISGIVNDGGVGCGGHLAATTLTGRNQAGTASSPAVDEQMAAVQERLDELDDIVEGMDEQADPEQLGAAAKKSQEMLDAFTAPAPGRPSNVVLPVYSPNVAMWQAGLIRDSEHSGVGGWQSNAAAHFVLLLKDATPEDLREGETFQAVAVAPEEGSSEDSDIPVSPASFYSRWEGRFQKIPGTPNASSGRSFGVAFQGVKKHVYGRLSGTVTIEKITGAVIESSFQLSGEATLVETEHRFKCMESEVYPPASAGVCDPDEMLAGSSTVRNGEKRRTGPISIEGRLRTPNRSAGGGVRQGYQNVVID